MDTVMGIKTYTSTAVRARDVSWLRRVVGSGQTPGRKGGSGALSLSLVGLVIIFTLIPGRVFAVHGPSEHVLFEKNSLYQYIRVEEDSARRERYLQVDNLRKDPQGGISIDDPEKLLFEYTRIAFASLAFVDREPENVLFVGLGVGAMPRFFYEHYRKADIDIVEIDPEIFEVAKKYFNFTETGNMKVHLLDGRVFIKKTPKKYDMIFLDAYKGDHIPFHLTTVEFLKEIKKKLKKDGVVVSNISSESNNKYFWSMVKTYWKEFPQLNIFRAEDSGNFIFIAASERLGRSESDILKQAENIQSEKGINLSLMHSWWWDYRKNNSRIYRVRVLTDDFAPVNLLRHMKLENQGSRTGM